MILYKVEILDSDNYWSETFGYQTLKTAMNKAAAYKDIDKEVRVIKEEVMYEFSDGEEYFG